MRVGGALPAFRVTRIGDPGDRRIEPFLDIRERDLVGRQGLFIAEGEVVLRMLLRTAPDRTVSILVDERRVERLAALLLQAPPHVPIYSASQAVMDSVTGFPIHRGVLGLGRRAPLDDIDRLIATCGDTALVVAAFGIGNHDNMGALFRNAAAFGVAAVLLDGTCCDPLYRKALRVSVGTTLATPFARAAAAPLLAALERGGFVLVGLSPKGGRPLGSLVRSPRMALLLGSEGPGLPPAVLDQSLTVSIPMAPGVDSLNVATTSGIVLHHLQFAGRSSDGSSGDNCLPQ